MSNFFNLQGTCSHKRQMCLLSIQKNMYVTFILTVTQKVFICFIYIMSYKCRLFTTILKVAQTYSLISQFKRLYLACATLVFKGILCRICWLLFVNNIQSWPLHSGSFFLSALCLYERRRGWAIHTHTHRADSSLLQSTESIADRMKQTSLILHSSWLQLTAVSVEQAEHRCCVRHFCSFLLSMLLRFYRVPHSQPACSYWLGAKQQLPKGWRPETSWTQQNNKKIQVDDKVSVDTDTATHF